MVSDTLAGLCMAVSGAVVKNSPAHAGDARDAGSVPASGRSPEEGNGNPLQYSYLENPMCWSFNGPEHGGMESKREKEADTPWLTRKANRVLFSGLMLLHVGIRRPLEWVKAQCAFLRGS